MRPIGDRSLAEIGGFERVMPKKMRFVIGAGLIVAAIGYLIITAGRNTAEYYMTVSEVSAQQAHLYRKWQLSC